MTDRASESRQFRNSFGNKVAREFLNRFLTQNYTDAILTYHPRANSLDRLDIHKKNQILIHYVFNQIIEHPQESNLFELFQQLSRNHPHPDPIWFEEFTDAYKNYKHHRKLINRYHQLKPYLIGSTYCDIGCGGGDLVAFLLKEHSAFTKAAGIDIMDWRSDIVRDLIDFQMLDFTRPDSVSKEQYDTLTCLAVLHHTGKTPKDMEQFLGHVKTAMKKGGRLIIEEDVIIPYPDQKLSKEIQHQIDLLSKDQLFLKEFLSFNEEIQRSIIISIDFLANCLSVGVPDMPFPCGFQTLSQWLNIFKKTGLKLMEVRIQGFVKNNFNQSFHVFFILEN